MRTTRKRAEALPQFHNGSAGLPAWLAGMALGAIAVSASADDLHIRVQQLKPKVGTVVVAVYDKSADFPVPEKRMAAQVVEALGDTAEVVFGGLAKGRYAVVAYQDENRNGKLDKNFLGLPIEPYGFSNDARGSMGPPSFDAASIDSAAASTIVINLH